MKNIPWHWIMFVSVLLLLPAVITSGFNADIQPMGNDDPLAIFNNEGSLSGYVHDTGMHPIAGVLVRVYFHGTYKEDYSDAEGYYHVTDIPICNCTKNCTASKLGFKTAWVWLSIGKNTRYDFVLHAASVLYVGGSGPGNYTFIQDAIDNATSGDTIYIYNGSYAEHLLVDKSLRLEGESPFTTSITGEYTDSTICITADRTMITNLTITRSGPGRFSAGVLIQANHTCIQHNIICDHIATGIRAPIVTNDGITHTTISNNTITQCHVGIFLQLCAHTLIYENIIRGNICGVNTYIGFLVNGCENTTIYSNSFEENNCGIDLYGGWDTTIANNNFVGNMRSAKFFLETGAVWDQNYWDRPRLLPKIIVGQSVFFVFRYPVLNVDWHPAQEPFNIGGLK